MTMKEIIESIDYCLECNNDRIPTTQEDLRIIKEALEKQIPKKPIKDDNNMACPMCGANSCHYCKYRKNCKAICKYDSMVTDTEIFKDWLVDKYE